MWCRLSAKIRKHENIEELETGTVDISGDWQPFMDIWFELVITMKVPHKAKKYDQFYFRTMFFPREDTVTIDGVTHEIANAIKVDTWNSKSLVVNDVMENFRSVDDIEEENFMDLKKKLIAKLKEFDKQYMKHIKKTHPDVQAIIDIAIEPILNILDSNENFHKIEELIKKGHSIPDFRYNALEDKFCENMETICTILKEHGNLKDTFAIKRMLNLLKLDNWEDTVPMAFYLNPLKESIKKVREEILEMKKKGKNRCKYYVEDNQPMHNLIIDMVAKDVTAQWLMGDKLKNDQLCFLYEVVKIVYKSSLKDKLVNKDKALVEEIIPKLACFRALLIIKDIQNIKFEEKKKNGGKEDEEPVEEEDKNETEASPRKKDEEEEKRREEIRQKKAEEAEIEKYGRKWIWQGYISENRKEDWLNTAEKLRHVNDHVISDIQDYIMLQVFGTKQMKDRKVIDEKVDSLIIETEKAKASDDADQPKKVVEKRKFEMTLRPPFVWNFFETRADREEKMKIQNEKETYKKEQEKEQEEGPEEKPYLINAFANPKICYDNETELHGNRVEAILKDLDSLTYNLKNHEDAKWKTLTKLCIEIFKK